MPQEQSTTTSQRDTRRHEGARRRSEAPEYSKPVVRDYGRIQPRLQFTPPDPPF